MSADGWERVLIAGALRAVPTKKEGLAELWIEVPTSPMQAQIWKVVATAREALAEIEGLEEGDVLAVVGRVAVARFPLNVYARVIHAERALALRTSPSAAECFDRGTFDRQVEELVAKATEYGAKRERARIIEIMHAKLASENLELAWALARDGQCSRAAAEEALRIAFLNGAPLPVGEAGEPLAH